MEIIDQDNFPEDLETTPLDINMFQKKTKDIRLMTQNMEQ